MAGNDTFAVIEFFFQRRIADPLQQRRLDIGGDPVPAGIGKGFSKGRDDFNVMTRFGEKAPKRAGDFIQIKHLGRFRLNEEGFQIDLGRGACRVPDIDNLCRYLPNPDSGPKSDPTPGCRNSRDSRAAASRLLENLR